jgi:hypothetical protein
VRAHGDERHDCARERAALRQGFAAGAAQALSACRTQRTHALASENLETSYSLVSSAVEGLELRQQLHVEQLKLGAPRAHRLRTVRHLWGLPADALPRPTANTLDDLSEMHTNYDILTNQLLVEQARPRRAALALLAVSDSCAEI